MKSLIKMKSVSVLLLVSFFVLVFFTSCPDDEKPVPALGELTVFPQEALVNYSTPMTARIKVPPGLEVQDTIVLIKIASNGSKTEIGVLLDDGNLSLRGDEIKGDGVFSGKINLLESQSGEIKFKAVARPLAGSKGASDLESDEVVFNVYPDIQGADMRAVFTVQNQAASQLNTYLNGSQANTSQAVTQLIQWLNKQPEIASVQSDGFSNIEIKYKSGLMGGIIISVLDENGKITKKGGYDKVSLPDRPGKAPEIPLVKQTRGKEYDPNKAMVAFDPNTIGNRNVFVYSAYDAVFSHSDLTIVKNVLDSLTCGDFPLNSYRNQEATVARLYEMVSYGIIVLDTHGCYGSTAFLTGEIVDTTLTVYQSYKPLLQGEKPKMGISTNVEISKSGTAVVKANVYKVFASFISSLPGTFPQSVMLNSSCYSDQTALMRDAFLGKGVKTYYGYTEPVSPKFASNNTREVFITLMRNNKKTGEVSTLNTVDPVPPPPLATFKIRGSSDMRFALDLVNGGFEEGALGWTRNGDGRVISQLGFLSPTSGNYMGIISTGLGYTTQTGRISQSFTVPANASAITLNWNFLSEEFLEYIGSSYQDRFEIILESEALGRNVIYSRTIDGIAAAFGASAPTEENPGGIPGDLIAVSPDIVFDRGGVYMTGWQSSTFDVTAYRGQCVTLIFHCTDVGDSIYDTAILLDDVEIK